MNPLGGSDDDLLVRARSVPLDALIALDAHRDPAARVEAIGTEIAALRAELIARQGAIAHRRGPHELAATPLILSLRARADRLQPLLADRAWAYTQWIHTDTDAETATGELDSARRGRRLACRRRRRPGPRRRGQSFPRGLAC